MATTTKNTRSSDDASSSVDDDSSSSSSSKSDLEVDEPDDDADSSSSPAATGASNNVPIISQQQQQQQQQAAPVHLSKSWSVLKSHVPLYTGGKISFLTDTTETGQSSLLLPMDGDLARVQNGTALATLRGDSVQDDDDDGVDANAITAYAVSSNNTTNTNFILTCSRNSILCQYDATTFARTRTWCKSGHTLPVTALEIHSSNAFCATASVDGSVRVWDVRGAYCTHVYKATDRVSCCQWHPTQLILAVGRSNGSIVIYTLTEKEESSRVVLNDHVSAVTCIEWIDHKNLLVTAGRDAVLNLWKISEKRTMNKGETTTKLTYERIHTLPIYEQVEGMVVLPHYYYQTNKLLVVATAGSKGKVRLWNIAPSETSEVLSFQLLAQQADSEAFGEARGGYTGMRLVPTDRNNSKEQLLVADAEHNLSFLSLSDNSAQELLKTDRTIIGHNDDILDLKVIPTIQSNLDSTTQRIVVATNSSKVRIFSLNDFSCQVLDRHTATVLCVDVSPCGQYVATCGKDKHMRVWNLKNNSCVGLAEGHTEAIGATALSRKVSSYKVTGKAATNGAGSFAVTVSMDRTLKRWNLPGASILDELASDNKCVSLLAFASVRAHEKDINIVSVAPNDSLIATGSQDKTVKLWNASDLSLQATLKGHRRGVWDCQFSPFDRVLATGSGDRTIKLWSLSDGYSCLRTFQGHLSSVLRVRFLSSGLQLISSGADGLLKLWTIRTNECDATMDGHNDKVWALDITPGCEEIVSGGADSKLVVWEDTTKEVEDAKQVEDAQAILMDQSLANHLRNKEYAKALNIALKRDKPHHALKVLSAMIEEDLAKGQSGLVSLKKEAVTWSDEHLISILRYCREWNTRALNSNIAMATCKAIVSTIPAYKLAALDGVPEILAGIIPYSERHFDRLDRLYASTYLLDFALSSMGSIEAPNDGEFAEWESQSKLVLPPTSIDGRIQIGGLAVVGTKVASPASKIEANDSDVIITVGDSDSSDEDE